MALILCQTAAHGHSGLELTLRMLSAAFGETNPATASVTILDNDPRCSEPGSVTFSVVLEAYDMDFRVTGDGWGGDVVQLNGICPDPDALDIVIGETEQKPFRWDRPALEQCNGSFLGEEIVVAEDTLQRCYQTERRGLEITQSEIPCQSSGEFDTANSLNEIIRRSDISIDMSASAQICRTLTGSGLLESEWRVAMVQGGETEVFTGSFDAEQMFGIDDGPIEAHLIYETHDQFLWESIGVFRPGSVDADPMTSGTMSLRLRIENLDLPVANVPSVDLEAIQSFRLEILQQ